MSQTARSVPGLFGPSFVVRGRLTGEGDLEIQGRFEGDVSVAGTITVGPGAAVVAGLRGATAVVGGHGRGNGGAASAVHVRTGGRIDGDVRAPRVAIDDGGTLQGGIEMDFEIADGLEEGS